MLCAVFANSFDQFANNFASDTSVHLQRGTYNGADRSVLAALLKALDRYLNRVVTTNQLEAQQYVVPRLGNLAATSFDLRRIACRALLLRPGGKT